MINIKKSLLIMFLISGFFACKKAEEPTKEKLTIPTNLEKESGWESLSMVLPTL
jgi:hypothetical protein